MIHYKRHGHGTMEFSHDNERFVLLFARHEARLRRYVSALVPLPEDVDDVMQETSLALMRKFEEYDPSQPFFNWACRFAFFEVRQHRKKVKTRRRYFSDEVVDALAREFQEHDQRADVRHKALEECVRHLGEQDRRLVEMRYVGDETVANLASRIEEPVEKLYRSLSRIRRMLADCVRKKLSVSEGI